MANLKDTLVKFGTGVHRGLYNLSGGRIGGSGYGMPVVILTTTGRKTGRQRQTVLTAPIVDGETVVLVASYGGDDRHPTWFLNLRDDPEVDLEIRGEKKPMTAAIPSGDERAELWRRVTADHANYAGYQTKTEREIPLVVLTPR